MAAEKRGHIVKLDYDFNTAGVLEVSINNTWYRVTSRHFRSFDGPRRITQPEKQPGQGVQAYANIKMITEEYFGPVYLEGTNNMVEPKNTCKLVTIPE